MLHIVVIVIIVWTIAVQVYKFFEPYSVATIPSPLQLMWSHMGKRVRYLTELRSHRCYGVVTRHSLYLPRPATKPRGTQTWRFSPRLSPPLGGLSCLSKATEAAGRLALMASAPRTQWGLLAISKGVEGALHIPLRLSSKEGDKGCAHPEKAVMPLALLGLWKRAKTFPRPSNRIK